MKKLVKIMFEYDDGTQDMIDDPRSALLFQSRCNTSGILSGIEHYVVPVEEEAENLKDHDE
jgi:hypothetical protein